MSYYRLGTNCNPATHALTSNSKFIEPLSDVYNIYYRTQNIIQKENRYIKPRDQESADNSILKELANIKNNRVEEIKKFEDRSCSNC